MALQDTNFAKPYFLRSDYLQGNSFDGTLYTRSNHRILVLPEELVVGLHKAIEYQAGQAMPVIMYTCGRKWGERMFYRWEQEWQYFYSRELAESLFEEFAMWLKQAFSFYGWGDISIDLSLSEEGIVQFNLKNSVLPKLTQSLESPHVCGIFEGLLAAVSSELSGRDLECVETQCCKSGHDHCHFAVALPQFIDPVRSQRLQGASQDAMMETLRGRA
ncbi:MAG: hypothetical protein EP343_13345 [Deltaproteobacteria bacterium]|nr:MAG: hypothetical protein EP343_13345 [Deltaproteobacteria bacterium]